MADTLKLMLRKGFRCCPFVELPLDLIRSIAEQASIEAGFGVVETIEFSPSTSRLVDVPTDSLPNGALMKVLSVEDLFQLVKSPTTELMTLANTTPMVAIESVANPGEVWIRLELGSNRWRTQTSWVIDPINGNEENTGAPGSPIQTFREFSRRMGPAGEIPATMDVTLTSDSSATDTLFLRNLLIRPDAMFRFFGTPTVLDSGTITAKTDINSATQTPPSITDAAQDFTTYIDRRLRITTPGPRFGAVAWASKLIAATQVRTSPWGLSDPLAVPYSVVPTLVNPQVGDAYVVESLPILSSASIQVSKVNSAAQGPTACLFADMQLARTSVTTDRFDYGNSDVAMSKCSQAARNVYGRNIEAALCLLLPSVFHLSAFQWRGCSYRGVNRGRHGSTFYISDSTICQGSFFFINEGAFCQVFDAASFDGGGMVVSMDSQLECVGLLWGNNNTTFGLTADGRVHYTVKPTITGLTADTRIGGTNTAYAGIPFFNVANGAMIVATP